MTHPSTPHRVRLRATIGSSAFLLASAMVLAGLLVVQAGRLTGGAPAAASYADLVASGGDFVALAVDGGNEDVLVVLDQRTEELLVYQPRAQSSVEFKGRQSLREVFYTARRTAGLPDIGPGRPATPSGPGGTPR